MGAIVVAIFGEYLLLQWSLVLVREGAGSRIEGTKLKLYIYEEEVSSHNSGPNAPGTPYS